MTKQDIYITTPIYYVNDKAHIGHAYTTMIADSVARYSRLRGFNTFFLTGTDEHGQKIEHSARTKGKEPKEYADEISKSFKDLWDSFEISYDYFIRTTDERHKKGVQLAFEKMLSNGDIYKDSYEGHYCISCEAFFPKSQLIDEELCPDCGKPTDMLKEESYFFRLSKYEDKLLKWYKEHEECILPRSRKNEVIKFVEGGLRDLSITRTSFKWGIKVPNSINDDKHVIYVWLDALMNYITALGYGSDEKNMNFWPAKVQIVGKDILRFHAIYWPAFLMSLGLPLPTHIAAHGWWTRDGEKMSKSKGNAVNPTEVTNAYGVDNFRYFLLREVPFGQDGDFSQKALIDRINGDLGNDLGNLLNRIIGMSGKYSDFHITSINVSRFHQKELDEASASLDTLHEFMHQLQIHRYLEELWKSLAIANKAIDNHAPWAKMKDGNSDAAMATVALVANLLAKVSILLYPIMPRTCEKIATALNFEIDRDSYNNLIEKKALLEDFKVKKTNQLFPRIEEPLMKEAPKAMPTHEISTKQAEAKDDVNDSKEKDMSIITIDQFFETSLKIGTIIEAKEVPKSKKLLKLQVDIGKEKKIQIIAGIKDYYSAESLIKTQVCVVANLKPAKLMGMLSEGMLLAAKDSNGLSLMRPEHPRKSGSSVG